MISWRNVALRRHGRGCARRGTYVAVVAGTAGWPHLYDQVRDDRWLLAPLLAGFAVQVGLMLELCRRHRLAHFGSGFTWYGGTIAVLVVVRRHRLPLATVAGLAATPLALAYGIGRLGCLLSGDGTYGKPSGLPWAMSVANRMVRPPPCRFSRTALYEALFAVLLGRNGRVYGWPELDGPKGP